MVVRLANVTTEVEFIVDLPLRAGVHYNLGQLVLLEEPCIPGPQTTYGTQIYSFATGLFNAVCMAFYGCHRSEGEWHISTHYT